ncbi:kinase-like domain-containing protein [Xylaria scruposa]|nr:kinase-like domain-containing protein [Xylaria scruposa]
MSQSSGPAPFVPWEEYLGFKREVWWNYRVKGRPVHRTERQKKDIYERYDMLGVPTLPSADPLKFFENWHWRPSKYLFRQDTHNALNSQSMDNENPNTRGGRVQARRREILDYFGQQRYVMQRILGAGGNGIAVHFRDQGPHGVVPGRDFVVKVALGGWQSDGIVEEKRMMKKVKGSAHCVQIIEPQDIGLPEEEPILLPLPNIDSSTDGDSSGNESLSRAEVLGRHRIRKRRERGARHWQRKDRRRRIRMKEVEEEIRRQEERGVRKDYIIMEYLQNGSLANLLVKLNVHERDHGFPYRIPNRVLWGFWLCLIRACIAMEYPPRKFHPLRKKPQPTSQNTVDFLHAKANKMVRDLTALGIRLLKPGERERLEDEERRRELHYQQLEGDLIEDLPERPDGPDQWKLERRQNMIHRDLDPANIFVNGLELDEPLALHWQETRKTKWKPANSANPSNPSAEKSEEKEFENTGIRPDRVAHEHSIVPRLKLGDFGLAVCIKREKTNGYYHAHRDGGKHGDYPPEFFSQEWDYFEVEQWGDQIADSRTAGYYSNKMNIWSSALTMWELITKFVSPTPPAPQPPYDEVDNYPEFNAYGQTDMDQIFNDPKYADFKVSYCALLRDPRVKDLCVYPNAISFSFGNIYSTSFSFQAHKKLPEGLTDSERSSDWVDEKLRETIFKCMYHKPDDRPSLAELLSEAERNVELDISGESDEEVRRWIQYWFFDAPSGNAPRTSPGGQSSVPPGGQPPTEPKGQPPAPPKIKLIKPQGMQQQAPPILRPVSPMPSGAEPGLHPEARQRIYRLNADFPNGYDRVFNSASGNLCGLFALMDSLKYQLGINPTINGVTYNIPSLPTMGQLINMHAELLASGALDFVIEAAPDVTAQTNFTVDVLAALLTRWSQRNNIELELVCKRQGVHDLVYLPSPFGNPKCIYIYNDNAEERYKKLEIPVLNHYEGLKPRPAPPPPPPDNGIDLPDYESDG